MGAKRRTWDRDEEWVSPAVRPCPEFPGPLPELMGLPVDEAITIANAAGWAVRARAPGAFVGMDLGINCVDLDFDGRRRVVGVAPGVVRSYGSWGFGPENPRRPPPAGRDAVTPIPGRR